MVVVDEIALNVGVMACEHQREALLVRRLHQNSRHEQLVQLSAHWLPQLNEGTGMEYSWWWWWWWWLKNEDEALLVRRLHQICRHEQLTSATECAPTSTAEWGDRNGKLMIMNMSEKLFLTSSKLWPWAAGASEWALRTDFHSWMGHRNGKQLIIRWWNL